MREIILEARQIVKRFPGTVALDGVDFVLRKSEIRALLGENGAGKSTLIKVITGVYKKDAGTIVLHGKEVLRTHVTVQHGIAFVPQELNLFRHLTVAENIFIPIAEENRGISKYFVKHRDLNRRAAVILARLDVDIDPQSVVGKLGTAQLQMVQIARAIAQNFEILILDEPTSSISVNETENLFKILRALKSDGKSIIYITHKLDEVFELADSVTILRDGKLVGSYEIGELDRAGIVQKMAGKQLSELELKRERRKIKESMLLEVKGLAGSGFKNINFTLHEGEILGVAGLVGAKRTEIAKTIFGALPKKAGQVVLKGKEVEIGSPTDAYRNGLVYMPEDRKQLGIFAGLSLKENITISFLNKFAFLRVISTRKENAFVQDIIEKFNIRVSSIAQKMAFLSGGNQQKAIIARAICVNPKVLIFDEPTAGIDVNAKSEIYTRLDELAKSGLGIIIISSEIDELLRVADRIIVVYDGQVKGEFKGDVSCREDVLCSALGI